MPGPSEIPAELLTGPFTTRRARALEVGPDVLRGNRFVAPFSGVRLPRELADDLHERCRALSRVLPAAAFSHSTAAVLWQLPVPGDGEVLEVTLPAGARAPRRHRVRGHTGLLPGDVVQHPARLPVVSPAMTWARLASRLSLSDLVVLGDAALAGGLTTGVALQQTLDDVRFRRGRVRAREALGLLCARSESPMESRLRLVLVLAGLPKPAVNQDVVVDGVFIARPDLSYPELKIAIEYEGDHHRTDRRQWRRDKTRRRLLEDNGWLVIEVIADDVYRSPEVLIARIRNAIATRLR